MNRPLLILILAMAAGIALAGVIKININIALAAAVLAWLAAGIGILRAWRLNAWVLFCAAVALGLLLASWQTEKVISPIQDFKGKNVKFTGMVVDYPDIRSDWAFYKIKLLDMEKGQNRIPVKGMVRVKVKESITFYKYGQLLSVKGLVNLPEPPGNPGAFDYKAWLIRQGFSATVFVKDTKDIKVLGSSGNFVRASAYEFRAAMEKVFDRTLNISQAAVLKGLIFGTRGEIPADVQTAFNETGLVHILSVSGYHVGLVVGLVLILLRIINLPNRYIAPAAIPLILLYAVMTGLGPPVTRAALMAVLLLLARHFGREQDWPSVLVLAGGIILAFDPLALYDIGFQLSFVATWSLLYLTPKMTSLFPDVSNSLALIIFVPLAAQLGTVPLVVLYFNLVSPVSILANLLTVHLVAFLMLCGGILLLLGSIHLGLAGLLSGGTGLLTDIFLWLVQMCASLPGASFYIKAPNLLGIFIYYLLLVLVAELSCRPEWQDKVKDTLNNPRAKSLIIPIFLFISLMLAFVLLSPSSDSLEVHFIDVGQGDSTLILGPEGQKVLIDAGGWKDEMVTGRGAGNQVVVPYLHRLGINSLDLLIITHPHGDHAGGVRAVIDAMPVDLVVVSPYGTDPEDKTEAGYSQLLGVLQKGNQFKIAEYGDRFRLNKEIELKVLSPIEKFKGTRSDANNNSIVMLLNYRGRSVLLTGDIETEAEQQLVEKNIPIIAEIIKVPHHGSGYFHLGFFEQVEPQVAVISVGSNNSFGHPSPKTLEALTNLDCTVYRTDLHGAVVLSTTGARWYVKTGKAPGVEKRLPAALP